MRAVLIQEEQQAQPLLITTAPLFPQLLKVAVFSGPENSICRPTSNSKACMCCLAGQKGRFQSQIVVFQPILFFFSQANDSSMLCECV